MGLIKEPPNIDFYTTGKQLTEGDQKRVSDYIKRKKALKKKKQSKKNDKNNSPIL
jgi:hypothetical protein